MEGSGLGQIFNVLFCNLEELREITKDVSQDSRSLGKYLNPGPPEYESRMLTTRM
jgi:hypothetical protein